MPDPELVAHLRRLGATDAQIADLDDGRLIGLAGDLALSADLDLTLDELAARCATTPQRIREVYRSIGLDVDALAGFGAGDAELMSLVVTDESGLVAQVADELLRVAGTSLRRVAEAAVAAYVQDVEHEPGRARDDLVASADLNHLASQLVMAFAATLATMFRHHMWVAVRAQRSGQEGVGRPELVEAAVGFVDLVGYTPMARTLPPAELMAMVDAFERSAFELATEHGGRIVKSIGDEVMIAAPDLDRVATIALALVESFGEDPSTRPRGGVSAGQVVFRLGDLYGPVVNVAARLVAVASPGEVLTDVAPGQASAVARRDAGTRDLKGFDTAVRVWAVGSGPPPTATDRLRG